MDTLGKLQYQVLSKEEKDNNIYCKSLGRDNLVPRLFTYARRFGKDPGCSWSRDSLENPLLHRVGKVSNYMLPHTSDTFQMQGVRFNCYERQYKLFDLKLSIFVYFVCFISFIIVNVWIPKALVLISKLCWVLATVKRSQVYRCFVVVFILKGIKTGSHNCLIRWYIQFMSKILHNLWTFH